MFDPTLLTFFAKIPTSEVLLDALGHLLGFALVLFTLTFLWLATALVGQVAQRLSARSTANPASPAAPAPEKIEPGVVAAISAAVYYTMGPEAKVVAIESANAKKSR